MRAIRYVILVFYGSVALSSCTCHKNVPEPPVSVQPREGAFGALATPRAPKRPISEEMAKVDVPEPSPAPELPTAAEVNIPEDFPADVPLFRDSKAFAVQELAGNARNVLFYADAETPEIFTHYRDGMQKEGWNLTQEYQSKYQSFLSFKKGNMVANMTISKDPRTGKQVVGIMYQEEEQLPFPEF